MNQNELDPQSPQTEYRLIPLSRGQFAKVDTDDYETLIRFRWMAQFCPSTQSFYARRGDTKSHSSAMMHRVILQVTKDTIVDHIDHDTLNNRRSNLRCVDHFQSAWNRRTRIDSTSGHKGVTWNSRDRLWYARLGVYNKRIHLGNFKTKEQAIAAYQQAAIKHCGQFLCLEDR